MVGPKCRYLEKAQRSGNIQGAQQAGRLVAAAPALLGCPLAITHPAHTCLGRRRGELRCTQPSEGSGRGQEWVGQGGHTQVTKANQLLNKATSLLSPTPTQKAQAPQPQCGSKKKKGTSSMKPPQLPMETSSSSELSSLSEGPRPTTLLYTEVYIRLSTPVAVDTSLGTC